MDLSTRLSLLFGSEEYVSMRRQLVFLRENVCNHLFQNNRFICSGSLGEGVAYPTSDDDIMVYNIKLRVVNTYVEATHRHNLLMAPGYCLLLNVNGQLENNLIHIINGMPFVSSTLWQRRYFEEILDASIHGPCQSGHYGNLEYDYARCIFCKSWPDIASNWIIRNRSNDWPSFETIQNIVRNGCHVVPVGNPDSPYGQHEWRLSFSVAERTLMHSFNHVQFLVYNILRLTLKRVIETSAPDVLCSYFMKTTLFYTAENTSRELWRVDNLEICLKSCLSSLFDYVDKVYCPNYFIPEYNMIKRKINQANRRQMLEIIRSVHRIGIRGVIHLSGECHCFCCSLSTQMVEINIDQEFMSSRHIRIALYSIDKLFIHLSSEDVRSCFFPLNNLINILMESSTVIRCEIMKIALYRGITNSCQQMLHLFCNPTKQNKRDYRFFKSLKILLKLSYNGDVTTGKLTMASSMYIVGKIDSAVITLRQLLSEYPPYAYDSSPSRLKKTLYTDVMCGRGYSIDYKIKRAYAPTYFLYRTFLNAFPCPLRMWISVMNEIELEPLTYTYFLQSLCYIQQRKLLLLKKSTKCLIRHTYDLDHNYDRINARMCMSIIKYVQGDSHSACRWMASAYRMKDKIPPPFNDRFSLSVLTYVGCILNKISFRHVIST